MPRDFRSFSSNFNQNQNFGERNVNQSSQKNTENVQNFTQNTQKIEEILNKYKNMSNNELMTNLFREASRLKSEGKLNSENLNSLKGMLAPFLNSEQQKMLDELIAAIND